MEPLTIDVIKAELDRRDTALKTAVTEEVKKLTDMTKSEQAAVKDEYLKLSTEMKRRNLAFFNGEYKEDTDAFFKSNKVANFAEILPYAVLGNPSATKAAMDAYGVNIEPGQGQWWAKDRSQMSAPLAKDFSSLNADTKDQSIKSLVTKDISSTTPGSGAELIWAELSAEMIRKRPSYGIIYNILQQMPMGAPTVYFRRHLADVEFIYPPGEGTTVSDQSSNFASFDFNAMTAFDMACRILVPLLLEQDANFGIGPLMTRSINYKVTQKMDEIFLLGNGTPSRFNQTGLVPAMTATALGVIGTDPKAASANPLIRQSANAGTASDYSQFTLADFENIVGDRHGAEWAELAPSSWIMHPFFYWVTAFRLAMSSGGVRSNEVFEVGGPLEALKTTQPFLGFPVHLSLWMPSSPAATSVVALFGSYDLVAKFGRRPGFQLARSDQQYFDRFLAAYRYMERPALKLHSLTDPGKTKSGGVQGLMTRS